MEGKLRKKHYSRIILEMIECKGMSKDPGGRTP